MLGRLFGKKPQAENSNKGSNTSQATSPRNDRQSSSASQSQSSQASSAKDSRGSASASASSRTDSRGDSRGENRSSNRNPNNRNGNRSRRGPGRQQNNRNSGTRPNSSSNSNSNQQATATTDSTPDKTVSSAASNAPSNSTPSPKKNIENQKKWELSEFQVPVVEGKTRFHDLDLPLEVMHGIADLGFEYCSPIQAQSLPYALNSQDVVGKAQTGTGKTAAFLLAIIDDLIKHPLEQQRYAGEARALILAPTRELVIQIAEDAKLLTKYTDIQVHALVGGMDYQKQQRDVQNRLVDILVATPGRLLDFCSNKDVHLDQIEVLVIDEADRMLDMGFIPQIRRIIGQTPKKTHRQTLLFSATFTQDILSLVDQWTVDPVTVEIQPDSVATGSVTQYVYLAAADEKYTLLYNILKQEDVESLMVFSNRRDECRDLYDKLKAHGFSVGLLSGEVNQNQRVKTLDGFKSGQLKVLVATDVAGRGIHIDGISHVVNLTLPEEPEDYVHRIGRTGRAGQLGTSISFACEDDAMKLMPIQELVGDDLKCTQPPEELLVEPPFVEMPKRDRQRRPTGNRSGGRPGGNRNGGRPGGNR